MTMLVNIEPENGWPQGQQEYFSVSFEGAKLLKRSYREVDEVILPFLRHTSRQKRSAWRHSTFIFKVSTGHECFLYLIRSVYNIWEKACQQSPSMAEGQQKNCQTDD